MFCPVVENRGMAGMLTVTKGCECEKNSQQTIVQQKTITAIHRRENCPSNGPIAGLLSLLKWGHYS